MKRRYEWNLFEFFNDRAVTEHFEIMARKGWQIDKIGVYLWRYRRAAPREARFAAMYFAETSDFNPGPTENEETLRDYCAAAGWEYVANWQKMLIFQTEQMDAAPIETESAAKLAATHRAMKRGVLAPYLLLLALIVFQLAQWLTDSVVALFSDGMMLASLGLLLLAAGAIVLNLTQYARWYFKSKASVARGGPCLERSSRLGRVRQLVLWASTAVFLLLYLPKLFQKSRGMAVVFLLWMGVLLLEQGMLRGIRALLKRRGVDSGLNMGITVGVSLLVTLALLFTVVSKGIEAVDNGWLEEPPEETYTTSAGEAVAVRHDPLPLTIEDLGGEEAPGYSYEWAEQGTPFLDYRAGNQLSLEQLPGLSYRILDVKAGFLFDAALRDWTKGETWRGIKLYRYQREDPAPWGADAAYQMIWNPGGENEAVHDAWILCRGRRIISVTFGWPPAPEQMARAVETLFDDTF